MEPLEQPKLRFWMAGPELTKLATAARKFFSKLGEWAVWPARQMEPMTASLPMLNLLAWQRCVTRQKGESERLYRLRVKYAYANYRDSGLISGWKRIFKRLELGTVELEERVPGQDWDIIGIVLDDTQLTDAQNVLEIIIQDYGRTCRRYRFVSRIPIPFSLRAGSFDNDYSLAVATQNTMLTASVARQMTTFDHDQATMEARA